MTNSIPEVEIESARRSFFERASIVWLVPVAALLIAVGIALNTWRDRGPVIEIAFPDAAGIAANQTHLKFRDVSVGIVERLRFSDSLDKVLVAVRIDKDIARFVDDDAKFWVVQPQVTTSGVSGLDTVLSGVYLEGTWDSEPEGPLYDFEGISEAPLLSGGQRGLTIELRSLADSAMTELTPIVYKGIEVGRIGKARISRDGRWVFADAIIYEPHDRLISSATRFWDTSGFRFTLGPSGAELDFSSVASLIAGGITFDTLVSGGQEVHAGTVFEVFPDEASARSSIFEESDGSQITISMIFDDNVSGLTTGAAVEWRGVHIGEVVNVTGLIDRERFGDPRVRLMATAEIKPGRLGLTGEANDAEAFDYLSRQVAGGLRARLVSASILTGGLKVEFLTVSDAPLAAIDLTADPFPVFPVTTSEISDVSATAEGVFQRLNALPIENVLDSTIGFLDSATAFITSEDFRETPSELRGLLSDARGVVGSEAVQALPAELSAALSEVRSATEDLRNILSGLREAEISVRVLAAIDQAAAAGKAAEEALAGLPDLTTNLETLIAKANALPLEELANQATGLAADARGLIGSDSARALPAGVSNAVVSLSAVLDSLTEANTAEQLSRTLTSAEQALASVTAATEGIPDVVARIDRIAAEAEAVRFGDLATELGSVLANAEAVFGQAGEADLPGALAAAFREVEQALAEFREGGLVTNANQTLASTRDAAAAVAEAAEGLPALVEKIDRALAQTQATLAEYDGNSSFSRELAEALRDIQQAAKSVDSLSRALERRPNSIILGR